MTEAEVDPELVRARIIITSARLRAELALREARRAIFGDATYQADLAESDRIDRAMRREPPPDIPVTLPGWKRSRWARRLLGR